MLNQRIKKVIASLERLGLDGLLVSSAENITYLTGYPSRDSFLLISPKKNIYFTDFRYQEEARRALRGIALIQRTNGSSLKNIAEACRAISLKAVGFEERIVSFIMHKKLQDELGSATMLVPTAGIVESLREVKDSTEIAKIREATQITLKALRYIRGFLAPGRSELEVAAELERFIRYNGAYSSSFEIIVASGPNSAFPHHLTSQRKLRKGEPVLIDIGVSFQGYKSDLTRVFFLGKITPLARRIYDIVAKAQAAALRRIKPGVSVRAVDYAARGLIARQGYAKFFGHSLGHGIGLSVHEAPRISPKEDISLKAGMVFTVEPGIYLRGKFGIRLEDIALVTRKGVEVLSGAFNQ